VQQCRVKNALEPEWEARFEPRSYGFRPGRSCHDAIEAIFKTLCGTRSQRRWILDADLAGAFDSIAHEPLLAAIGAFPARGMIREWLTAGVIESGRFTPAGEGTPQGGVISPCLLNVALHGMEHAAGVRYRNSARSDAETVRGCPVLVRYADDYVAMCYSREQAGQVQARLAAWLEPRGLRFNPDKTRIVHVEDGFSFLGFDIRRHVDRHGSGKLLITPGKEQVKRLRNRLTAEVRALRGANAAAVIARLAPIIRGSPGLVGLLPERGLRPGVHRPGPPRLARHLQVGQAHAPEQAQRLGHRPVLRHVQPIQAGPVGIRRPGNRRLPHQVLLDQDRPARPGARRGVPRRLRPGPVLG
jgi:RNA-directed DNA polymerase